MINMRIRSLTEISIGIFTIFLYISLCGCSPQKKQELPKEIQGLKNLTVYSTDIIPSKTIEFEKEVVYGNSEEELFGIMGDIAVDHFGRVFIADIQNQEISVYDSGGRFITQLGREGKGPREFGSIRSLQIQKDRLYIYDTNRQRISVITLDSLAEDKSVLLAGNRGKYQALHKTYPWIYKIFVRNNGTYLAEFVEHRPDPTKEWQNVEMRGLLYPLASTGEIASNKLIEFKEAILTNKSKGLLAPIEPFFGIALTILSSDNTIYRAGPEYFLIKKYNPEGDYRQAFYYPLKKIPLTQKSAVEAGVHDFYIQNMKFMDLPSTWPVLTDMKIDDEDRLWIATTVEDMTVYQWWVLNLNGQLIARFTWPRDRQIEEIKDGYLYVRETEEETEIQEIVRYRIDMD